MLNVFFENFVGIPIAKAVKIVAPWVCNSGDRPPLTISAIEWKMGKAQTCIQYPKTSKYGRRISLLESVSSR